MILLCTSSTKRLTRPPVLRAPRAPVTDEHNPDMVLLAARTAHLVPPSAVNLVGDFISPRARQLVGKTPVWAADNDAFSGFNPDRYRRMLDAIVKAKGNPMFVTVPDVVCNHPRTLDLWYEWSAEIRQRGLPAAFVLQNGCEDHWHYWHAGHAEEFPFETVDAFFIGGDTEFKFSEPVREIVSAANLHGKWVHMGRVNSIKRMTYAKNIGCDSCDGSGMARFPSTVLLPMVRSLQRQLEADSKQLTLL